MSKPFKGQIFTWYRFHFNKELHRDTIPEETLGYIVYGYRGGFRHMRTSPVIFFDEYTNRIETLNSWYELVGDEAC
jgi:hypothetical protein